MLARFKCTSFFSIAAFLSKCHSQVAMKPWHLVLLALPLTLFGQSQFPEWSWKFVQTEYIVGPSDSVLINAMITVAPSSPIPLQVHGIGGGYGGDLQKIYSSKMGEIWDYQKYPSSLAPGQSITLSWLQLTPLNPLSPGRYPGDYYDLGLAVEPNTAAIVMRPENNFTIVVVPEPAPVSFVLAGISLLFLLARRNPR